jgi:uncharacterized protein (DUF1499 family)
MTRVEVEPLKSNTRSRMQHFLFYAVLTVAVYLLYMVGLAIYSWQRPELGIVNGALTPCGSKPNCVCSQGSAAERTVAALPIESRSPAEAFDRARDSVESLPRSTLVTAEPGYARYECCTQLFRFADDVELLLDEAAGVIQVRSARDWGRSADNAGGVFQADCGRSTPATPTGRNGESPICRTLACRLATAGLNPAARSASCLVAIPLKSGAKWGARSSETAPLQEN